MNNQSLQSTKPGRGLQLALAAAVAATLAGGCASQASDGSTRTSSSLPADCILSRGIRDYSVLDDANLLVYGPGRVPHHVVLTTPALDISQEFAIGILDRDVDGRICPYGGDSILIDGVLFERIPIRSIERIDREDVELLQIEFGVIEPAEDQFIVTPLE